jgi:hypothetical protein
MPELRTLRFARHRADAIAGALAGARQLNDAEARVWSDTSTARFPITGALAENR